MAIHQLHQSLYRPGSSLLDEQALLAEGGGQLRNPAGFVPRGNELILGLAGG